MDVITKTQCLTAHYWEIEVPSHSDPNKKYTVIYGIIPLLNRSDYRCTCKGYYYRGVCSHINDAKKLHCGWQQEVNGGWPMNNKCPNCNGPITHVTMAV